MNSEQLLQLVKDGMDASSALYEVTLAFSDEGDVDHSVDRDLLIYDIMNLAVTNRNHEYFSKFLFMLSDDEIEDYTSIILDGVREAISSKDDAFLSVLCNKMHKTVVLPKWIFEETPLQKV